MTTYLCWLYRHYFAAYHLKPSESFGIPEDGDIYGLSQYQNHKGTGLVQVFTCLKTCCCWGISQVKWCVNLNDFKVEMREVTLCSVASWGCEELHFISCTWDNELFPEIKHNFKDFTLNV